jgi:hypothetical protein
MISPIDYNINPTNICVYLKGSADLTVKNIAIELLDSLPSFITFSETERTFFVSTSDAKMIGIYTVVVVANYSQYNATAFTSFSL